MPDLVLLGDISDGSCGYVPSPLISTPVTKTFFKGKLPAVVDQNCFFAEHVKPGTSLIHPTSIRTFVSGSSNTLIEGFPAARVGDPITCGDSISVASSDLNIQ